MWEDAIADNTHVAWRTVNDVIYGMCKMVVDADRFDFELFDELGCLGRVAHHRCLDRIGRD